MFLIKNSKTSPGALFLREAWEVILSAKVLKFPYYNKSNL